jgi:ArsR family transcriptional regulator
MVAKIVKWYFDDDRKTDVVQKSQSQDFPIRKTPESEATWRVTPRRDLRRAQGGVASRRLDSVIRELSNREHGANLSRGQAIARPGTPLALLYFEEMVMKSADAVTSLEALAQESRLAIIRLLARRGPEGFTPGQLSEKLPVAAVTLSFHLKVLHPSGLLNFRREGRFLYYSPNFPHMNELLEFLADNCCSLADKDSGPACGVSAAEVARPKRKRA